MLDLGQLPALDVAVGLAFMYFLLSIVCSSIGEVFASIFKLRAQTLETGVRALLGSKNAADKFFEDWRLQALGTPKWTGNPDKVENSRKPSYVSPSTAALVILDTVAPKAALDAAKLDPDQPASGDVLGKIGAELKLVENEHAKVWLSTILKDARGDLDAARTKLEDGFNEVMDRATGWYKRKIQIILFCVALAVAAGINADTINVADRLARDDALRARVVAQAAKAGSTETKKNTTAADVEAQIKAARATALPLGWNGENVPDGNIIAVVLKKVAGLVLTAFALTLGAPFWFDLLGKFARVRSSGNRTGTPKDDTLAASDRDDRLKRTASVRTPASPPG